MPPVRPAPRPASAPTARSDGELLDIGEVAARSGVAPSALRYYERRGLIVSEVRHGLRRQYRAEVVHVLGVIQLCQRAGFTLAEITELLATGGRRRWKALADRKRRELREQIRVLTTMADELDHAMACPSPNVADCEHFRAAVRATLERAVSGPLATG